jgi:catechol-2,3-dioxygenase
MATGMTKFTPRATAPTIKVADIAHLRFARLNLAQAERYFLDFGLKIAARTEAAIYFRGVLPQHHCVIVEAGPHDRFAALGLRAASAADLRTLAVAHSADVEARDEPGGGEIVRLVDPSGFAVEVVHGLLDLPRLAARPPRTMNLPDEKRRKNAPQPALVGPAEVFRLGHAVMQRQEFARNANWYVQSFGLIASDVLLMPGTREPLLAFMRCDRGDALADHHTVVIALGPEDGYDHAAFEVQDIDALGAGAEWLQRQGWVKAWGIGRHLLGSQLFSYHYDPSGFTVEHYADGDVFNADYPTGWHEASKAGLYLWGPVVPDHFVDMSMTRKRAAEVVHGLRTREDFTVDRVLAAKRVFSAKARPWSGQPVHRPKAS